MLGDLRLYYKRIEGEDSVEYTMLTCRLATLARRMKDPVHGLAMLDEGEGLWSALCLPVHRLFAHTLRHPGGFAVVRHAYGDAGHMLGQAITVLENGAAFPVDPAIARSELAMLRALEYRSAEANQLLGLDMPILRSAQLSGQIDRARAEQLVTKLGAKN